MSYGRFLATTQKFRGFCVLKKYFFENNFPFFKYKNRVAKGVQNFWGQFRGTTWRRPVRRPMGFGPPLRDSVGCALGASGRLWAPFWPPYLHVQKRLPGCVRVVPAWLRKGCPSTFSPEEIIKENMGQLLRSHPWDNFYAARAGTTLRQPGGIFLCVT